MKVKIENRIFGKNWKISGIYLNMKLHEEVLRIRELLGEEKEQKIFRVPGLDFFHEDPREAWQILQKVLEQRGNPPYSIGGDLYLRGLAIKSLGDLTSVGGSLDLAYTSIKSLGNLTSVGGYLDLRDTPIESLGNLTSVGGWLVLRNTPIESLGNLTSVGDTLNLRDTPLSRKYTEEQIRQMVDVGGKIYM
jgi:hypothetical protein